MTETNTENIDVVAAAAVPAPNQTSRSEDVELTIRSAYQAENDLVFSCPITWSVKQVKEHVKNCLETHPAVSTQRLIFAGAPLRDEQILSNILNERSYVAGEQIFIHLMIAQPYVNDTASEVRRRNVTTASSAAQA
uniref:Ubiquitin-like domain-containing protein n=1 Tax=Caenorhabditis japonica TaxID=281687 RepID=A0A8R1DQD8_CAEJA